MLFWVKLICPAGVSSSCAMVVMRTGAFIVLPLRRVAADIYPLFHKHIFSMSRRLGSNLHTIDTLRHFSSSLGLSSAGVAPRKLLDGTVKTFTVFPSWLYLLDGEDNCMLSVPFSTSDLHYSWQSGENCQVVSAGAFTLLCCAFWFSLKGGCSPFFSVLLSCPRVVCSMFCCCHRDSLTRGRLAFAQEGVRGPPPLSPRLVLHMMTCARRLQAPFVKCLFKR